MRLIGRDRLKDLQSSDEQAKKWLLNWVTEVINAQWKHTSDVSSQFPSMRIGSDGHFTFPIANCKWAICLLIAFPQGIALITDLKAKDDIYGN